jgi:pilus assembly protein CpaF
MSTDVLGRVRRRLVDAGIAPDRPALAALVRAETGGLTGDADVLDLVREAASEFTGAGPLDALLRVPGITDVLVNGPGEVWVDRGHGLERVAQRFADEASLRRLAQRLAAQAGRRLDDASPYVDAALPDGTRLHAVLPPIAGAGTCLSLRTFRRRGFTLGELEREGTLTAETCQLLREIVKARLAFMVTGGTGSGKTTLLGAVIGLVDPRERLLFVEDAAELRTTHHHVVRLAARPPNVEGAGEVSLRDLVRQALRMRPDRLIVGEVRGAEVVELLTALNTGHAGSAGTVHANSASELPARLEALGTLGGLNRQAVHSQAIAALQVVLHLARRWDGRRVLAEIAVFRADEGLARVVPAWRYEGGRAEGWKELATLLDRSGARP